MNIRCFVLMHKQNFLICFTCLYLKVEKENLPVQTKHLKTSLNMLWNTTYFVLMILRNKLEN